MARSTNQKKKLIILRDILLERTDACRLLSVNDMISALAAYGIKAERKSIYDDIEVLRELGLDIRSARIASRRGRSVGYYVAQRRFELPELKLLADAVSASRFISDKKSRELIEKLASLAGANDRKTLNRAVYVSGRERYMNEEIYLNIDVIFEAISADNNIEFRYFGWNAEKKKVFRRMGEKYNVSPMSLVWDDSNYYLVGFDLSCSEIRHYRVDRMQDVRRIDGTKRQGAEEFNRYDMGDACEGSMFGMFGGKTETVALRCDNSLANVMIDRFGSDLVILNDGESFRIHVKVVPGETFYGWVAGFSGRVKILSPENIVLNYKETINQSVRD